MSQAPLLRSDVQNDRPAEIKPTGRGREEVVGRGEVVGKE
jgi:hypothetical protein